MFRNIGSRLSRRKKIVVNSEGDVLEGHRGTGPKLLRVLSLSDLTFLGIGSTLGLGIYVLAGSVAKDIAGPAVCLSFLVAAVASGISALCYAEFGARVPKAGSAYIYSYITVGELIAFVIGWNLILEYLIGTASVARALSLNVDTVFNHSISNFFTSTTPIYLPHMSHYADWLALGVCILMTVVLALGVKSSSVLSNVFTILNLVVILFVVIIGALAAKAENWNLILNKTDIAAGNGGFMPYGVTGVMAGAAKCFFGFVGFDSIAATGEEAKNPKRAVPLSIMLTLVVVLLAYVGISIVLTLMVPYHLQDKETPLVFAFQYIGQSWAAVIVTIGSIVGLTASLLGSMIPMPRIVYAMAKDGLLFRFLATIHPRFKTPFTATLFTGIVAAIFSMVTELDALVDMMSIGTLLAYTLVAVSILIVRFEHNPSKIDYLDKGTFPWQKEPTPISSRNSKITISAYCAAVVLFCSLMTCFENLSENSSVLTILLVFVSIFIVFSIFHLSSLPRSTSSVYFMVPLVPLIPALSILINVYLMLKLSLMTWIRFSVWLVAGFFVYGCYGVNNSSLETESCSHPEEELSSPLVIDEESSMH